MIGTLLSKIALPLFILVAGFVGGISYGHQFLGPDPCPACTCPEPTVSVQPFDVDKIKGVKTFTYSPQFSGSISVAGVDSTALRKMIDRSIDASMAKYSKRKR